MSSLKKAKDDGYQLDIRVVGMLVIASDVPRDLALQSIRSIVIFGVLRASQAVRLALGNRITYGQ